MDLGESPSFSSTSFTRLPWSRDVARRESFGLRIVCSSSSRTPSSTNRTSSSAYPLDTAVCLITFSTVSKLLFLLHIFFYAVARTTAVKLMIMMTTTMVGHTGDCHADDDAFLTFCTWFFTCASLFHFVAMTTGDDDGDQRRWWWCRWWAVTMMFTITTFTASWWLRRCWFFTTFIRILNFGR